MLPRLALNSAAPSLSTDKVIMHTTYTIRDDEDEAALEARRQSHNQAATSGASLADGAGAVLLPQAVARLGAERALAALCRRFGSALFEGLPPLWDLMTSVLLAGGGGFSSSSVMGNGGVSKDAQGTTAPPQPPGGDPQAIVHALQVLKVAGPCLHPELLQQALQVLPSLVGCCSHANAAVRLAAARCAAALAAALPQQVLPPLLRLLLPLLEGTQPEGGWRVPASR